MLDWWEENGPPVYISAAAYLGLTKKRKKSGSIKTSETGNLEDLARMFSASGGVIQ